MMSLTDDDASMDRQQSDPAGVPMLGGLKALGKRVVVYERLAEVASVNTTLLCGAEASGSTTG